MSSKFDQYQVLDGYEEIFCGSINMPSTCDDVEWRHNSIECLLCQTLGYKGLGSTQIICYFNRSCYNKFYYFLYHEVDVLGRLLERDSCCLILVSITISQN